MVHRRDKATMRNGWLGLGMLAVIALLWAAARLALESAAFPSAEAALPAAPAITGTVYLPLITKPHPTDLLISRVEVIQGITMNSAYRVHIANRPGILRVFPAVTSTAGVTSVNNVSARLSCYQGAALQTTVNAGPLTVLAAPSEGSLSQTFNFSLPPLCLAAGASYVVDLDTTNVITEASESNNRYPLAGTQSFDWQSPRPVKVKLIPIQYSPNGQGPFLPDTTRTDYVCYDAPTLWPINSLSCSWGAPLPFTTVLNDQTGAGWDALLNAVTAQHIGDADTLYYGVVNIRAAGQCSSGCVAGMGWIGFSGTAVGFSGWNQANNSGDNSAGPIFTHEGGHNFGRPHAPCGTNGEQTYPYVGGIIGQWGYNVASPQLYNPNTTFDYMSYCGPEWTSDYTYKKIFDYRATHAYAPQAAPQEAFAVSGSFDAEGAVQLAPITAALLPLTPASAIGTHRAELLDAQDRVLASLTFTPVTIALDRVGPDGRLNSGSEMLGFHLALPAVPGATQLRLYVGEQLLVERALVSPLEREIGH